MPPRHASEQQRTEAAKHVRQSGAAAERNDAKIVRLTEAVASVLETLS
jgi:hypothetical protein